MVACAFDNTSAKPAAMSPPDRHMLLSHTVAAPAPGFHHDGLLWQFSSSMGRPVALISAAHRLMFMAEPH